MIIENKTPTLQEKWPNIRTLPYKWQDTWLGVWTSFSHGRCQDIHFKFLHLAIPTYGRLASWKGTVMPNAYCKHCLTRQKQVAETDIHLFIFLSQCLWLVEMGENSHQKIVT